LKAGGGWRQRRRRQQQQQSHCSAGGDSSASVRISDSSGAAAAPATGRQQWQAQPSQGRTWHWHPSQSLATSLTDRHTQRCPARRCPMPSHPPSATLSPVSCCVHPLTAALDPSGGSSASSWCRAGRSCLRPAVSPGCTETGPRWHLPLLCGASWWPRCATHSMHNSHRWH
jgi:hypothetical protein